MHALRIANNSSYAVLLKKFNEPTASINQNPYSVSRWTTLVLVLDGLALVQTMLVCKGLANFLRLVGEGVGKAVGRYWPTTDLA
jgi:hypothetical protein